VDIPLSKHRPLCDALTKISNAFELLPHHREQAVDIALKQGSAGDDNNIVQLCAVWQSVVDLSVQLEIAIELARVEELRVLQGANPALAERIMCERRWHRRVRVEAEPVTTRRMRQVIDDLRPSRSRRRRADRQRGAGPVSVAFQVVRF
jgi:hypothetical protein